jgi:hypothetical protein
MSNPFPQVSPSCRVAPEGIAQFSVSALTDIDLVGGHWHDQPGHLEAEATTGVVLSGSP